MPRVVAIITPRASAPASVLSASARAPSTSPRAARISARTPRAKTRCGSWSAWRARSIPSSACRSASSQLPGQELRPAKLGEYPRHRALLATFLGLLEKGSEELARAPELVNPGQYHGEGEGRADGGLNRDRAFLEPTSARNRRFPFVSARHRVDEDHLAQSSDLHARAPGLLGEGDRGAGMTGSGGQVAPQQEECTCEPLLGSRQVHDVVAQFRRRLAVEVDRLPTVALVLLYRAEPVKDLAAPRSGLRGGSRLAQELPGALALAGLPGGDRGLDGTPVSPFLHVGGRQAPGELGQLGR